MADSGPTGHPTVVLVTAGDPSRRTGGYLYNRHILAALTADGSGGRVEQLVLPEGRAEAMAEMLRRRLAALRPRVAIVDSIILPAAALAVEAARRDVGVRVLALMHMLPSDAGDGDTTALAGLERRLLAAADRVVAVSPDLRERLVRAGARADRVEIIVPGRDGCAVPPESAAPRRRSLAPRFLAVANWSPNKGIHLVVEAMARLDRSASLDLVGETGGGDYEARVRGLIERRGLGEQVRIHGSLPPEQLEALYAAADAFVLPSRSEGFGIVFAEAMAAGLPIVAARVGPLPWLVEEGCGLLVPPDDVAALADALLRLARDPALRRRMGHAARLRARRLPTWAESEAAMRQVVRQLLAEPAPRPSRMQMGR